jgi:hypothetical protein
MWTIPLLLYRESIVLIAVSMANSTELALDALVMELSK